MSPLQAWMARNPNENDATLADKAGVSRVQISRVRRQLSRPSLELAAKLEELTGIPAASFAKSGSPVEEARP